jgi:nitroreductase
MNVYEAILQRKSTRAFLPKEVEREKIVRILDAARHAPSGANTQPWQVAAVSGRQKRELQTLMENAFAAGEPEPKDYRYYPEKWLAPYSGRRTSCGMQLYSAVNIERQDREQRRRQWAANYRAFDAPVMLLFFIDSCLATGSYLDYGMFLQSLMLAALEEGLATCPQAALAEYPRIVRGFLGYPDSALLLCGIALGYEDTSAPINQYRTPREEVVSFTRFFE